MQPLTAQTHALNNNKLVHRIRNTKAHSSSVVTRARREERRPNFDNNFVGALPSVPISSLLGTRNLRGISQQTDEQQDDRNCGSPPTPMTVYSVRFTTGSSRGGALTELACVNVCLLARDGRAAMYRVSPVFDPLQDSLDMADACQVLANEDLGADCIRGPQQKGSSSSSDGPVPYSTIANSDMSSEPRVRFQEGTVDEVCFVAPELGKLAGILVGTESGSWALDEVHVASSRTGAVHRFVCRSLLGAQPGEGACFLTPVPAGSVIYGSGSSAIALSKEESSAKKAAGLAGYESLKQRLLTTNVLLVAIGTGMAGFLTGSPSAALAFAAGGGAGVLYQWLLQQGVDSMAGVSGAPSHLVFSGKEQGAVGDSPEDARQLNGSDVAAAPQSSKVVASGGAGVRRALGRPVVRFLLLAALGLGGASVLQGQGTQGMDLAILDPIGASSLDEGNLLQLALGVSGFLAYKVALISVSIAPEKSQS